MSGTETSAPDSLFHDTPNTGSFHLKSMEGLRADHPVVLYDQLGAGRSDRTTYTILVVVVRYAGQLDSRRRALNYHKVFF